ncbi:hypothetical protein CAXC1_70017 [Candidatus Xenohaliotis californiensis]|uniref:Uncharacterized protein n=1 Tax=Candidatus Xenohaliotis californiensis TaxID=84677 RepID=A0ABM9N959_9RICK|nr:hypothetical protein CAXC1_70017 [Candidatus Xenohaliotis californiensis]
MLTQNRKKFNLNKYIMHACGGVAQLVRASACHVEGRGFDPRHSRQIKYS